MREHKSICVYCGTRAGKKQIFTKEAKKLGSMIGENGFNLVYEGGSHGMMGAVAEGAAEKEAYIIGIMPKESNDGENSFSGISQLEIVPDMLSRKKRMRELSDAFILLPGGFGTMVDIFEFIALRQNENFQKLLIIVNIDGYYDKLIETFNLVISTGFAEKEHKKLYKVVDNIDDAFNAALKELKK